MAAPGDDERNKGKKPQPGGSPSVSIKVKRGSGEVSKVKEGETVIVFVSNPGGTINDAVLVAGNHILGKYPEIPAHSTEIKEYDVRDYIGEHTLQLLDHRGKDLCSPTVINVEPKELTQSDYEELKHARIPGLIKRLRGDNVMDFVYLGGDERLDVNVLMYPTEKLLDDYSAPLVEVTREIVRRLSYHSENIRRTYKEQIKGHVNWPKTVAYRNRKGSEATVAHVCDRRRRFYDTPTNLVLTKFHFELFRESRFLLEEVDRREKEMVAWKEIFERDDAIYDEETSKKVQRLRETVKTHYQFLVQAIFRDMVPHVRSVPKNDHLFTQRAEVEAAHVKNRAYKPMVELWKEYVKNYTPVFEKLIRVDTQRMGDIFEFWCVLEIAEALKLKSVFKSIREFKSDDRHTTLYYQKLGSIRSSWTEGLWTTQVHSDAGPRPFDQLLSGPDVFLHLHDTEMFIDADYGIGVDGYAKRENVYRILAHMNDHGVKVGVILYPGRKFSIQYDKTGRHTGQVFVQLPVFPISKGEEYEYEPLHTYLRYVFTSLAHIERGLAKRQDVSRNVAALEREVRSKFLERVGG